MGKSKIYKISTQVMDERFFSTEFVIEATSCEQQYIWQDCTERLGLSWVQENPGLAPTIGIRDGSPICVMFSWNIIGGVRIMFYTCTSLLADHEMVDTWLKTYCNPMCDNGTRRAHADAMNFSHIHQRNSRK